MRQFALRNCMRAIIQRIFSPPESTFTFFNTSSPENNIRPRKPFIYTSLPSPNWLNQSTRFKSLSKNLVLSTGRYAVVMVTPQANLPACGLRFSLMISKRAVMARGSRLRNTILSPFSTLKLTSLNNTMPSSVSARKPETSRI